MFSFEWTEKDTKRIRESFLNETHVIREEYKERDFLGQNDQNYKSDVNKVILVNQKTLDQKRGILNDDLTHY